MAAPKNRPAAKAKPAVALSASVDWRQLLIVLRSHLPVALAIGVVACSLLAWQQMRKPKIFQASTTLQVERAERPLDGGNYREDNIGLEIAINTRLEQLRTLELTQRVVASLTPDERAIIGVPETAKRNLVLATVRSAVSFQRVGATALLMISAEHENAAATSLLANRYAEQAVLYTAERSNTSSDSSLQFIRDQAEAQRQKVEAAERALQEYRQKHNLVSLEANQNIIVDNLKLLNSSATAARVARVGMDARVEQAETVLKRGDDPSQLAAITGAEGLAEVARRLADLRNKRVVMGERYGKRHPIMQENQRAIEAMEKTLSQEALIAMSSLRDKRDKALSEEKQLDHQRSEAEKASLGLDQRAVEYNILRRSVEIHRASYSQMLSTLNEATIAAQLRGASMKLSELALPPNTPISPNLRKTVLMTVGLAMAILLGYPFSAEMFFGRVRSGSDVEVHLGADLVGEIGSVRRIAEKDRPLLVNSQHDEAAAEQFRALHSQLALSSKIDPPKTILVSSTVPGEGKSFIAANLAECFVAHSRRTLLIDADLRRPTQHRNFSLDNKNGIIRWLEEGASLDGDLLTDPKLGIVEVLPGLFLLRAGGLSRRATELLEAGRLTALIEALQRKFDIVILDTPPAGVFPDAVAFAKLCHEALYICRFNTVSRQSVREVLTRLRQTEVEMLGVVLNAMPAGFGGGYYYKGYSYQGAKRYAKHYTEKEA